MSFPTFKFMDETDMDPKLEPPLQLLRPRASARSMDIVSMPVWILGHRSRQTHHSSLHGLSTT